MLPESIGPYSIVEELGRGGMGTVYLAQRDGKRFALKLAHEQLAAAPNMVARFLREAQVGRTIDHPNVVRTLDAGDHEGLPYLVMELVEGRDLRQHLEALGRIPEALLREVACQAAQGLTAIHAAKVVHRDIKPENILITDTNEIRLMDLGVAALQEATTMLTREGAFAGSLLYAAPEQFRSEPVTPATDRYSLGVVLYELACGENPFAGEDVAAVIQRHLNHVPAALESVEESTSAFFSTLVATLLNKAPSERFDSTQELVDLLREGEASAWWSTRERRDERPRVPVVRETALFGRTAEAGRLREAWQAARAGAGSVLVLRGEPGIGKTRLLDDLLTHAASTDAHLLYGAFTKRGGVRAIGDALGNRLNNTTDLAGAFAARARGEPPPAGAPDLTRDAFAAVAARTARCLAEQKPLLWILDDAQHADETARAALDEIARAAPDTPMLFVVAATEPIDLEGERLELRRLGARDVIDLLADSLRSRALAERLGGKIAAKSDGVPLFIFELLHTLEEANFLKRDEQGVAVEARRITEIEVPSTVRGLIDLRLDELDDDDRDLLDVAAVQGPKFDPGLVAAVLERKRVHVLRRLATLERRTGMVRAEGGRYRFDQRQVQETLESGLEPELAREYHELLREAYEDGGSGEDAVFLARHGLRGTDPERGKQRLTPALEHLEAAHRNEEQIELAETALAIDGLFAGDERVELLLRLQARFEMQGRLEPRRNTLQEARDLAAAPHLKAKIARQFAGLAMEAGDPETARREFEATQKLAHEAGDTALEGSGLGGIGVTLDRTGQSTEALTFLEAHVALAEASGDGEGEMIGGCNLALALSNLRRNDEALAYMQRSYELSRTLGHQRAEAIMLGNLAMFASARGDGAAVIRHAEACIALARETGNRSSELYAVNHLGYLAQEQGRYADCLAYCATQEELARDISDPRMEAVMLARRAVANGALGRTDDALTANTRALELFATTHDARSIAATQQERAGILLCAGRDEEASAETQEALRLIRDGDDTDRVAHALMTLAEIEQCTDPYLEEATAVVRDDHELATVRLMVIEAAYGSGDRAAAAHALRGVARPFDKTHQLRLWLLLGERDEARQVARFLIDHAPPECRESMVEKNRFVKQALAT